MEPKQYTTKQPIGHCRNQTGNFKKYLKTNENENTVIQNLWDTTRANQYLW